MYSHNALNIHVCILLSVFYMGDKERKVGSGRIDSMDHRSSDVDHIALLCPQAFLRSVLQNTSSLSLILPLLDLPGRLDLQLLCHPHVALLR